MAAHPTATSNALWNLLLGILDKATLTLGDNRKVDFSNAFIFMTSNIGAAEMSSLVSPKLGFHVSTPDDCNCAPTLTTKLSRTGIEAARRKFTPESSGQNRGVQGLWAM